MVWWQVARKYVYLTRNDPISKQLHPKHIIVTPADQMSDKSGLDVWSECHAI